MSPIFFRTSDPRVRWIVVSICVLVVLVLYGLFDPALYPFPPCPFRTLTGLLCPGCGSQRAMHQLLQGQFVAAFRLNPLMVPGILYITAGAILPVLPAGTRATGRLSIFGSGAARVALAVIVLFWIGRNLL